jgi:hypothetical protein
VHAELKAGGFGTSLATVARFYDAERTLVPQLVQRILRFYVSPGENQVGPQRTRRVVAAALSIARWRPRRTPRALASLVCRAPATGSTLIGGFGCRSTVWMCYSPTWSRPAACTQAGVPCCRAAARGGSTRRRWRGGWSTCEWDGQC